MVDRVQYERRIQDLVNSAWLLAALAAAPEHDEPTEEHLAVLDCAGRGASNVGAATWPFPEPLDAKLLGKRLGFLLSEAAAFARNQPASESVGQASVAEGIASAKRFSQILDILIERSPTLYAQLAEERVNMLDVGCGIGGILSCLLSRYEGATGVGLDIDESALQLGQNFLKQRGVMARAELRHQDVCELGDEGIYDLAWVPMHVLSAKDANTSLARIVTSLRPGGFQITAVGCASSGSDVDELGRAVARWRLATRDRCTWDDDRAIAQLRQAGLIPTHRLRLSALEAPVILAQKPIA